MHSKSNSISLWLSYIWLNMKLFIENQNQNSNIFHHFTQNFKVLKKNCIWLMAWNQVDATLLSQLIGSQEFCISDGSLVRWAGSTLLQLVGPEPLDHLKYDSVHRNVVYHQLFRKRLLCEPMFLGPATSQIARYIFKDLLCRFSDIWWES